MARTASDLTVAEVVKAWNKSSSSLKKVVAELETTESALKTKIRCNKELQSKLKNIRPEFIDIEAIAAKTKAAAKAVKAGASRSAAAPKAAATAAKTAKANTVTVRISHPRNSSESVEESLSFDDAADLKLGLESFASRNATFKVEPYVNGSPVLLSSIKDGDVVELRQKDAGAAK